MGIGTNAPSAKLDVAGSIRAGDTTEVTNCGLGKANGEGAQRYNYTTHKMEYCNGSAWTSSDATPPTDYLLVNEIAVVASGATNNGKYLQVSYIRGNGATVTTAQANNATMYSFYTHASSSWPSAGTVDILPLLNKGWLTQSSSYGWSGGTIFQIWTSSSYLVNENITSIVLNGSTSNVIGVDSVFRLFRRK